MGDERDIRPDPAGDPTSDAGPTVTQAREPRSTTMRETLRIEVIEGPDAGGSIVLSPSSPLRVLVGTGPACHLLLTDATVSRRHLAFEPSEGRFRISDLGSRNGTFVDGVAVVEAFIAEGQIIRCGSTALRVDSQAVAAGATLPSRMRFGRTLGASEAMRRLFPLCERLAASRVPVLIEGETGTGKEVLAESIHEQSGLSGPFVVFDCTTVAPSLLEAELFGHERGAFTGATSTRPGIFEQAMGGTIFIDEIGDFDLALQPKLLRAIDRGEIRRVGGKETIRVDARILAATRRDLDREVAAGRFRDDLFHRLAVGRIELPALRERKGDVSLLARAFAEQLDAPPDTLTADLLARLEDYAWPGNVRELRNAVLRRVELGELPPQTTSGTASARLTTTGASRTAGTDPGAIDTMFDPWVDELLAEKVPFPIARRRVQERFERRYVERVLEAHGGNVSKASIASGIARRYFQIVKARSSG
jgi:two-component system response regulator HydG